MFRIERLALLVLLVAGCDGQSIGCSRYGPVVRHDDGVVRCYTYSASISCVRVPPWEEPHPPLADTQEPAQIGLEGTL